MVRIKPVVKKISRMVLYLLILAIVIVVTCNLIITISTRSKCYDDTADMPYNKVGMVLGTSPRLRNGNMNLYFEYRIQAATKLYKAGKVSYLLVSGDNRNINYNEPQAMKKALVKNGVPAEAIYLDYAGLRTWDSVIRTKEVFGQQSYTIISQEFHNARAVFIAQRHGIDAIGYNAQDVTAYYGFKTIVREWIARVAVFADLITGRKPRHLGEPIEIV